MLSKFPRQTLIFRLPPPYLQESKELTATCHCHNNQCRISCGDLLASSKSLVVEKMSQLLLLLPHTPTGGSMLYRPSGLRMLTRGRAWMGWGINKSIMCKYALGLSCFHLLLTGKYGLSLSWNVKTQELDRLFGMEVSTVDLSAGFGLGYPHWCRDFFKGSSMAHWHPALGIGASVSGVITYSFALPCPLYSVNLGSSHGDTAGFSYLGP